MCVSFEHSMVLLRSVAANYMDYRRDRGICNGHKIMFYKSQAGILSDVESALYECADVAYLERIDFHNPVIQVQFDVSLGLTIQFSIFHFLSCLSGVFADVQGLLLCPRG